MTMRFGDASALHGLLSSQEHASPPAGRRRAARTTLAALGVAALCAAAAVTPGIRGRWTHTWSASSAAGPQFSDPPTDYDFLRTGLFVPPLVPVSVTTPDENRQLAALLVDYTDAIRRGEPDDV